jgi:uncharacterized membrane protein YjjP (DUF1212 family)
MKSSLKAPRTAELLEFMLVYAKHYLGSGGPTSRLEDSLERLGAKHGRPTDVYGTPTGIFISLHDSQGLEAPTTALGRIREASTDLGRLAKLEQVFTDVEDSRISVRAGLETLKNRVLRRALYSPWQSGLAAFCAGFAISFDAHQRLPVALGSGIITCIIWALSTFFLKRHLGNPLFTDFIAAFLTLVLAALGHGLVVPLSIEAYALGGIVLLVPGLALTTAISELAEQNLVSGTAKFMQATLALLALALAYLLFQQLAFSLHLRATLAPVAPKSHIQLISAAAIFVNVTCFSVIFKVPPKALIWSALTGFAGWLTLLAVSQTRAEAAGPFLGSVMVGIVSLGFGRLFRLPSQVYSVPGIIAMLPGMLALSSFRYFTAGDQDSGMAFTFKVGITAISIVFGLMTARIPFQVRAKVLQTWEQRRKR